MSVISRGGKSNAKKVVFTISRSYEHVGFEVLTAVVMKFQVLLASCFHAGFLLGLFFDPEDRGNMFLQNVG
jgi:hypothetical protein